MRWKAKLLGYLLLLAVFVGGCQPFKYEKEFSIEPGVVEDIAIDPPSRDQNVKVTFNSSGVPVSVYVVLEQNGPLVQEQIRKSQNPDNNLILAKKEKAEEGTVEAKIPAKSGYIVLVAGGPKKSTVKIKITGS